MSEDVMKQFQSAVATLRRASGARKPASELMRPIVKPTPFTALAKLIVEAIRSEHRQYSSKLAAQARERSLSGNASALDEEAMRFVTLCLPKVKELNGMIEPASSPTVRDHRKRVVKYLVQRLMGMKKLVDSSRKMQQKRIMSTKSRLSSGVSRAYAKDSSGAPESKKGSSATSETSTAPSWLPVDSEAETARMHQENKLLVRKLETELEEARDIEAKMVEISGMMELFATKVMEQHDTIETLYDDAQRTRENLTQGNKYLVSAAKHSLTSRIWMLCFLIGASLILLVLDSMA